MSCIIQTESHGEIEGGFYSSFTAFVRVGDYSMPTREFCDIVKAFATNPQLEHAKAYVFESDKFFERYEEHMQEIEQSYIQAAESLMPEFNISEM